MPWKDYPDFYKLEEKFSFYFMAPNFCETKKVTTYFRQYIICTYLLCFSGFNYSLVYIYYSDVYVVSYQWHWKKEEISSKKMTQHSKEISVITYVVSLEK